MSNLRARVEILDGETLVLEVMLPVVAGAYSPEIPLLWSVLRILGEANTELAEECRVKKLEMEAAAAKATLAPSAKTKPGGKVRA